VRYFAVLFLLVVAAGAGAQGRQSGDAITLYVKTTVYPYDSLDKVGHGKVEAQLKTKSGFGIPGQEIELSSTCGTFSCKLPDIENEVDSSSSADNSCFFTGKDGKIVVYLINIPFNSQGSVAASCSYRDMEVRATCTFWITKTLVKTNKSRKNSPARFSEKIHTGAR
jgi:hypothetical protein